jgi:hypothetical protein
MHFTRSAVIAVSGAVAAATLALSPLGTARRATLGFLVSTASVELLIIRGERKFGATLHTGQRSVLVGHFFHLFCSQRLVRAGRTPWAIRGPALP